MRTHMAEGVVVAFPAGKPLLVAIFWGELSPMPSLSA